MITSPVSTAAWALHDLGLATLFGGSLFGKVALHPAANLVADKTKRGEVINDAWSRFKFLNAASLAAVGITWFAGRAMRSGREVGRHGRKTVMVKDALVGSMLATGAASMVVGMLLERARRRTAAPMRGGMSPLPETPPEVANLQRAVAGLGDLTMALAGGVQLVTCLLALQGSRSTTWSLSSRFLP